MKQTIKTLLGGFTMIGIIILFVFATTTNINKSYSQNFEAVERLSEL